MSEQEQAELAAKEAEEAAKAEENAQDEQPTDGEHKPDEESIQLEATLKREREAREKAEKAAADTAFKLREERRKNKEADDEERPLTKSELQAILAEEREATQKVLQESETKKIVSTFSDNPKVQELVLEVYKNRSFPSHLTLEEKLGEAYLIANKDKVLGENAELKRAVMGKKTASKDSSTTHHDEPTGSQPKLPQGEAQEYARLGFTWNATKRRFEKKLPDGRILVKDKSGVHPEKA